MNILFVISGPSGVGKGTLVRELLREDPTLALSVSCTTRPPRKGERHGVEYFFISREEFEARIAAGEFMEYDEHFDNYYGTLRSHVAELLQTKSVILEIDVVGGIHVAEEEHKKGADGVPVILIMIVPPDMHALDERLAHRGAESEEQLVTRRARVEMEMGMRPRYDYVIVNDDFEAAKKELRAVMEQEKTKSR